ncbi:hypothetical protein ACFQX7_38185 [Luedemannella flava]
MIVPATTTDLDAAVAVTRSAWSSRRCPPAPRAPWRSRARVHA